MVPVTAPWVRQFAIEMWTRITRHKRVAIPVILVFCAAIYVYELPYGWSNYTPLNWDQSFMYLQATRVADGLRHADWSLIRPAVRGSNTYSLGHNVSLGSWFLAFGNDISAWVTFGFITFVGTALLLFYIGGAVSGIAFTASPLFLAMAPSLMVEPLAGMLLALTIALFPVNSRARNAWAFAAFGLAATAVILTKYNVGLPILPAAIFAALLTRERRFILGVTSACVAASLVWAAFLTWQDNGWTEFTGFARNRSNSADLSSFDRLGRYTAAFSEDYVGSLFLALVLTALAIAALLILIGQKPWAEPISSGRLAFVVSYVIMSMVALSNHEYFNPRSASGPIIALLVAGGMVAKQIRQPPRGALSAVVLAVCLTGLFVDHRPVSYREGWFFPPKSNELQALSNAVLQNLQIDKSAKVVGTFNEFSEPWVTLLASRHGQGLHVSVDASYPLQWERTGLSHEWSTEYIGLVDGWYENGLDRILGIVVKDDSAYATEDYELWNRWKLNIVRAAVESLKFKQTETVALPGSLTLLILDAQR